MLPYIVPHQVKGGGIMLVRRETGPSLLRAKYGEKLGRKQGTFYHKIIFLYSESLWAFARLVVSNC